MDDVNLELLIDRNYRKLIRSTDPKMQRVYFKRMKHLISKRSQSQVAKMESQIA